MKRISYAFLLFFFIVFSKGYSNNISVSNVSLTGRNVVDDYTLVQFDISWDNSWRVSAGPANWDAAWVFVKYRHLGNSIWNHASLNWVDGSGTGDGHTLPANGTIASSNDNGSGISYGAFIYRDSDMAQGSVNYTGVQLRWEYGVDGVFDGDSVEICVFAIEMVYVPEGLFYVGDGATLFVNGNFEDGNTNSPYLINSEASITLGGITVGNLANQGGGSTSDDFNYSTTQLLPTSFPKGYNSFYCMKYEITQTQYTEFLNKLTPAQDGNRFPNQNGNQRHTITGIAGGRTTTNPYIACNHLSWGDIAAYLDWAALRPMTELEFEKACRGNLPPIAEEAVWGIRILDAGAYVAPSGLLNAGAANEIPSNATANCSGSGTIGGPMRVGCFGQGINTRTSTGATYYGIMEMGGNVYERTITLGNATGRIFTGVHGDGELDGTGNANVVNWPGTNAIGSGFRGGNWSQSLFLLPLSFRQVASSTNSNRSGDFGGRGIRTAP